MVETLLLLSAAVIGAILFCAVAAMSSLWSGWGRLAERFRAPEQRDVVRFGIWQTRMSGVRILLTIGASRAGPYLATPFLFRLFHPPLLIPWSELHPEPLKGVFLLVCRLRFRTSNRIYLDLRRGALDAVADYLRREFGEDAPLKLT